MTLLAGEKFMYCKTVFFQVVSCWFYQGRLHYYDLVDAQGNAHQRTAQEITDHDKGGRITFV